ncbi:MAG: hypothetical protein QOH93_2686 [Chloroflexia bacterium]|nr:hypothetical protein [Chloroflexia bacterium]
MEKHWLDYAAFLIQLGTLIFLLKYVVDTARLAKESRKSTEISAEVLREMRQTREEESAPYVVVYFDSDADKPEFIHLVIKNLGKKLARDVRLIFEPPLANSHEGEFANIPLLQEGIGALAPGQEVRTFFDSTISYLGRIEEDEASHKYPTLPLVYNVTISYLGGLNKVRTMIHQKVDLSYRIGLFYTTSKGVADLVKEVDDLGRTTDNIYRELEQIKRTLSGGIWIKNPEPFTVNRSWEPSIWKAEVQTRVSELRLLWTKIFPSAPPDAFAVVLAELKVRSSVLRAQLLTLSTSCPTEETGIAEQLLVLAMNLYNLERPQLLAIYNHSAPYLEAWCSEFITLLDETESVLHGTAGESRPLSKIA